MFYCGTTSPGENPHCQAKPHPCHQIPLLPTSHCKTRAAKHTHPLHHLLGQNEAQQSQVPGKERGFRESQKDKWLEKSQHLPVLWSKFTGLKLFTWLGPVPCPLKQRQRKDLAQPC